MNIEQLRIAPGQSVDLGARPTRIDDAGAKSGAKSRLKDLAKELSKLQEVYYAEGTHRLLVVLQAMDTGGKDSTIRDVFGRMNPQGVRVTSFKAPTPRELAHDYLWRVHPHVPGDGQIAIFNRSHYEDVLVVRVEGLVPEDRWRKRYDQIVAFERLLAEEGTTIVKFFIHISKEEQRERLQARLDDPEKRWKFSPGDLETRERWDRYQAAYTEVLERTSTTFAPWYVIPGDRRWHRKLLIAQAMVDLLRSMNLEYPQPAEPLDDVVIP